MRPSTRLAHSLLLALPALALATTVSARQTRPIQDNSFLVEEAYNQEKGVVQHINTFARTSDGVWGYSFTQEWPIGGLRHQLGYTLQVLRSDEVADHSAGFGDIALNYRNQLVGDGGSTIAFAPRVSALLPTGSSRRGLGSGGAGVQVNLPLSIALPRWFVLHSNVGATYTPRARDASDRTARTLDFALGQSVIWLVAPKVNLLLEAAWLSNADVTGVAHTERTTAFVVSPGIRAAFDFSSGLQIVPGVALPIGVGAGGQRGIFAYLSLEHPFGTRVTELNTRKANTNE